MNTVPVVHFRFGDVQAMSAAAGRSYTVVYDGQCKVCGRLVKLLDRWDTGHELEVIPFQNTSVLSRFPWIPAAAYAEAVQLIGPGGKTWQGGEAIEQLLKILPYGLTFGWAFKVPGFGSLFGRFYRWFARNRYKFGCGEHCRMRPQKLDFGEAE